MISVYQVWKIMEALNSKNCLDVVSKLDTVSDNSQYLVVHKICNPSIASPPIEQEWSSVSKLFSRAEGDLSSAESLNKH